MSHFLVLRLLSITSLHAYSAIIRGTAIIQGNMVPLVLVTDPDTRITPSL